MCDFSLARLSFGQAPAQQCSSSLCFTCSELLFIFFSKLNTLAAWDTANGTVLFPCGNSVHHMICNSFSDQHKHVKWLCIIRNIDTVTQENMEIKFFYLINVLFHVLKDAHALRLSEARWTSRYTCHYTNAIWMNKTAFIFIHFLNSFRLKNI